MTWKDVGTKFDGYVEKTTGRMVRIITRRDALRTAILTGAATVGTVALGMRPAMATVTCPAQCCCSPFCSGCPGVGCPSGYHLCKRPECYPGYCEWYDGSWVHCKGYGNCGNGYTLCQDCRHNNHPCSSVCICVSQVICGQCCTQQDVRREEQRIRELLAAD